MFVKSPEGFSRKDIKRPTTRTIKFILNRPDMIFMTDTSIYRRRDVKRDDRT